MLSFTLPDPDAVEAIAVRLRDGGLELLPAGVAVLVLTAFLPLGPLAPQRLGAPSRSLNQKDAGRPRPASARQWAGQAGEGSSQTARAPAEGAESVRSSPLSTSQRGRGRFGEPPRHVVGVGTHTQGPEHPDL